MSNQRDAHADHAARSIKRGSVKEAIGKLTGNVSVEAEGKAEKESPKSDVKPGSTRTP